MFDNHGTRWGDTDPVNDERQILRDGSATTGERTNVVGTSEWPEKPLGDLAEFRSGGTPSKTIPEYWNGSIPWISARDMHSMYVSKSTHAITEAGAARVTVAPKGSVLLLVRGMGLFNDLPVVLCHRPMAFNQDIKSLVPKPGVDGAYLACALLAQKGQILRHVDYAGHGTGRLATHILRSVPLPIPPLHEQRRIAAMLAVWDRAMVLLGELRATTLLEQRGIIQQVINEGEHSDVRRLGEMGTVVSGGTPKTSDPRFWNGSIPWATPTDVTRLRSRFISATQASITGEGLHSSSAKLIPSGSILICTRATIGELAITTVPMSMNQGFKALTPNEDYDSEFIYYLLKFSKRSLVRLACGSTFLELSKMDFENLCYHVPPLVEQRRIATILATWDRAVDQIHALETTLLRQKRSLMRRLLRRPADRRPESDCGSKKWKPA